MLFAHIPELWHTHTHPISAINSNHRVLSEKLESKRLQSLYFMNSSPERFLGFFNSLLFQGWGISPLPSRTDGGWESIIMGGKKKAPKPMEPLQDKYILFKQNTEFAIFYIVVFDTKAHNLETEADTDSQWWSWWAKRYSAEGKILLVWLQWVTLTEYASSDYSHPKTGTAISLFHSSCTVESASWATQCWGKIWLLRSAYGTETALATFVWFSLEGNLKGSASLLIPTRFLSDIWYHWSFEKPVWDGSGRDHLLMLILNMPQKAVLGDCWQNICW